MRKLLVATLSSGVMFGTMMGAQAMPMAGAPAKTAGNIEQVAYGCGPGWRPGPYGRCVPMARPYYGVPIYRAPVYRPVYRAPVYRGPVYRGPYRGPVYRGPYRHW